MVLEPVSRPTHVVDRDHEVELPHFHFLSFSYIFGLKGLFHCVWGTRFILEHFSFHLKRFLFAQDTVITVKSGGIKLEYAFLKFLQSIILVLFRFCIVYFRVATLLDLCILFSLHPV
jgi:hypothetical protein